MAELTREESATLVTQIRNEGQGWKLPGNPNITCGRRKSAKGGYHVWMRLQYPDTPEWSKHSWDTTLRLSTIAEESWITSAGGSQVRYRIGKLF